MQEQVDKKQQGEVSRGINHAALSVRVHPSRRTSSSTSEPSSSSALIAPSSECTISPSLLGVGLLGMAMGGGGLCVQQGWRRVPCGGGCPRICCAHRLRRRAALPTYAARARAAAAAAAAAETSAARVPSAAPPAPVEACSTADALQNGMLASLPDSRHPGARQWARQPPAGRDHRWLSAMRRLLLLLLHCCLLPFAEPQTSPAPRAYEVNGRTHLSTT